MPGFVFLSRKVELLGFKIIEFFLRSVLPVLNLTKHSWKKIEAIDKGRSIRLIPFLFRFIPFFFALYKLTWDVASSFPFSLKGKRKRFLFYNQSFFVMSPIKSIPFLKFSQDYLRSTLGITCGRGSFAVYFGDHLRSRDQLRLGIICGTVQYFWTLLAWVWFTYLTFISFFEQRFPHRFSELTC